MIKVKVLIYIFTHFPSYNLKSKLFILQENWLLIKLSGTCTGLDY